MNPTSQRKEKGPGALCPRRDGLPGSSPQRPPAPIGPGREALPMALQRQFYPNAITHIARLNSGKIHRHHTLKPHIYKCRATGKWVCTNYYAFHRATSPVYAWRGFVRNCVYTLKSPYRHRIVGQRMP